MWRDRIKLTPVQGLIGCIVFVAFSGWAVVFPEMAVSDSWRGPQSPAAARIWGVIGLGLFGYALTQWIRLYKRSRHPDA